MFITFNLFNDAGENLTPQQLQRREEQLRKMRRMQEMLFPEKCQPQMTSGGPSEAFFQQQLMTQQQGMMGMSPRGQMMMSQRMVPPQDPDQAKAQLEWQRLQEQYMREKQVKIMASQMNQNMPGPPGPPPPYNQSLGHRLHSINSRASSTSPHFPSPAMSPGDFTFNPHGPRMGSPPRHPLQPGGLDQNYNSPEMMSKLQQEQMMKSGMMLGPMSPQEFNAIPGDPMYGPKPPAYAQSHKMKEIDTRKEVIPVPSPQPMSYVNAFDTQELTIQKQLNTAYMEPGVPTSSVGGFMDDPRHFVEGQFDSSHPVHSAVPHPGGMPVGPGQRIGAPMAQRLHSSMAPRGPIPDGSFSPNMSGQKLQPNSHTGHEPYMPGPRLSHFDPGHSELYSPQGQPGQQVFVSSAPLQHIPPTVNNTFVNATMSIQQLNIQNIPGSAYNAQMQVGQTNMQPNHPGGHSAGVTVPHNANVPHSSAVGLTHGMAVQHGAGMPVQTSMGMHQSMSAGHQQQGGGVTVTANQTAMSQMGTAMQGAVPGQPAGPKPPGAVPNPGASVQVQANAPNTIQYRPANTQPTTGPSRPPNLDFLQRFAAPIGNLDKKAPKQNLQYFPPGSSSMMKGDPVHSPDGMYAVDAQHAAAMHAMGPSSVGSMHGSGPGTPGMPPGGPSTPVMSGGPGTPGVPGIGPSSLQGPGAGPGMMQGPGPGVMQGTASGMMHSHGASMMQSQGQGIMHGPGPGMSGMPNSIQMSSMHQQHGIQHPSIMGQSQTRPSMGQHPQVMGQHAHGAGIVQHHMGMGMGAGMSMGMPPTGPGPGQKMMMSEMRMQSQMHQSMPGMTQSMHMNASMQPLDPNQPFFTPASSDPAYSVQFQNFQKQLYATASSKSKHQPQSSQGMPF